MNHLTRIPLTLALSLAVAAPALAGGHGNRIDYARVTDVEPITRLVQVSQPRQECWEEQVVHREEGRGRSGAGTVLGGLIGGAVGSRFGGGDGKVAAAVAGSVLGAAIGNGYERRHTRQPREYVSTETRCRTVDDRYTEERTIGYRVHYRYHGEDYVTRMDRHPGDRIRVRVSVAPAE